MRALVARLPLPPEQDRDTLYSVLEAREAIGSTGVGDGIAIPHVRNPIVLHVDDPFVMLALLQTPVEFGAIDDQPVHALFMVVSPTVPVHLRILAELGKHPIKTQLALTGTLVVARDIAHAKLKERLDRGEGLPQYFKDHPVYYAGPAKTPAGCAKPRRCSVKPASVRRPPWRVKAAVRGCSAPPDRRNIQSRIHIRWKRAGSGPSAWPLRRVPTAGSALRPRASTRSARGTRAAGTCSPGGPP